MSSEHQPPSMNTPEAPKSEYMQDGRLKIVIAGLDQNIHAQAIDAADARLERETNQKGGIVGYLKNKVWKGVFLRDSYRQKYETEAAQDILQQQNLFHHHGVDSASYERATTLRLMHDYEGMVHDGERRRKLGESDENETVQAQDHEFKQQIFGLIEEYASGDLDKANFEEKKKRLLKQKAEQGFDDNVLGADALTADNLFQIAQNVKAMVAYQSIDEIWENTDIIVGNARVGARTEMYRGAVERLSDKLKGKAVNEAMVGAGSAIALTSIGRGVKAATVGVSSAIVGTSLPIAAVAAAGVTGGMFENRVLKQERSRHTREMASGPAGNLDKRRMALEATRYETRPASELTALLGGLYEEETLRIANKEDYQRAMRTLAEIQARIQLSDERGIDLISFSSIDSMEQERFDLDLALAKAKCDVRKSLQEQSDNEELQYVLSSEDSLLTNYIDAAKGLNTEIDQKDRLYKKLRNKRISKAMLKATLATALTGGLFYFAEEGISYLKNKWNPAESAAKILKKDIPTSKLRPPSGEVNLSGNRQAIDLGEYAKLDLPEEFQISQNLDGSLSIAGPEGFELNGLTLKEDGHLTSESEQLLRAAGFEMSAVNGAIAPELQDVEVSAKEFLENHQDLTTDVSRDTWWENGTTTPDGTELGLHDAYLDSEGNIVVTMSNLDMATSSMVDGEMSLGQLAENGELKLALSASMDTQAQVFLFDMNANGQAIIPPDSPAFQSLFDRDGNFQGGMMEVVQVTGENDEGASKLNVFATALGPDANTFHDTVPSEARAGTIYRIEYNPPTETGVGEGVSGGETTVFGGGDTAVPLATSVYSRNGLESLERQGAVQERLIPISETEAARTLENMKPGDRFDVQLAKYRGNFEFTGMFGGKFLFEAIDSAGQSVSGHPIYTMTKDEVRQILQNGRLKVRAG